jgi:hypothetical protein
MAQIEVAGVDVQEYEPYSDLDPTKQQENLAYVNEQLWDLMRQAGFILNDGQMGETEQEAFQTLWTKQDDLINQQSTYLDDVKSTFNAKASDLPSFSLDELLNEYGGSVARTIVGYFFGAVAGTIAEFAVIVAGKAIEILGNLYTSGGELCDKMKAENEALIYLPFSKENYQIRSRIISQHDSSINNLLIHVFHSESQINEGFWASPGGESSVWQEISDTLKRIEARENIVQCPVTGCHIYTKELVWSTPEY